jgi:hypothetical protein
MSIKPRDYIRSTRAGTREHLRRVSFVPMLMRPEFDVFGSRQRDNYLERLGSGNFRRVDASIYFT